MRALSSGGSTAKRVFQNDASLLRPEHRDSGIDSETFLDVVRRLVGPALEPLGFVLHTSVSGRMYTAEFVSPHHVVLISFEPGDRFLQAAVFTVTNGARSDLDDRDSTPRLSDLNKRFLQPDDAKLLAGARDATPSDDPCIAKLVKTTRELAIVLPRYFAAK